MRALLLGSVVLVLIGSLSCRPSSAQSGVGLERASAEIVGGVSEPSHWYVVMVGDTGGGFCSGTLISKRTVLTAGHCWSGFQPITRVYFEKGSLATRVSAVVATSVRHPNYSSGSGSNDLALVKLSADAPVQPVPLLRETMTNTSEFIGPQYTFVGFGDINANGVGFGTRRVVTFPIEKVGPSQLVPGQGAPQSAVTAIDSSEFYYRWPSKNTCFGDSGGPAFVVRNGVERHAGATSYGDDECVYDGVQARTDSTTLAWIQQTIDAFEPQDVCRANGVCEPTCVSTDPAPLGTLTDPDCADQHCEADGVCVLSCATVDADCASLSVSNCAANGICQLGCSVTDADCVARELGAPCGSNSECTSGFCASGVCCGSACQGGCQACSVAQGASADGTCGLKQQGAACRAQAGVCDVAEACSGDSPNCPSDAFMDAGVVCRVSAGACDVEEVCSGQFGACPADLFAASSTVCRPSQGDCDIAENCTGSLPICPADLKRQAAEVCRAAAGECDVAETCTGLSDSCPSDGFKAANSVCRASAGVCDIEEICSGALAACPGDGFAAAGVECRASQASCDVAETCTGAGISCPADAQAADGSQCNGEGVCKAGACEPNVPEPLPGSGCGGGCRAGGSWLFPALGVLVLGRRRRRK